MPLPVGTPAPDFRAPTHRRLDFLFSSLGGFYVLLAFLPADRAARDAAMSALMAHRPLFDDRTRIAFSVIGEEAYFQTQEMHLPGLRHFLDADGAIASAYKIGPEGAWVILDPGLRLLASFPAAASAACFGQLTQLDNPDVHAGTLISAPVLVVPRGFEPEVCAELMANHAALGGRLTGVMREVDGLTVEVHDDFKSRRDVLVEDEAMKARLRAMIVARLKPEMAKAFAFIATRLERYLIARYDAEEGGHFQPHRDNTTRGTAHRQFACTINLNAEAYDGGDLRFPEFGSRTYRAPTGGAIVFSCSLLHEVTPMTRGARYAFLPFFFNEDGERLRQQNLRFVRGLDQQAG
ncbi:MAG: 2OG-Fe(II) oxygenase [Caulobacteraceae bacterium]